MREHREDNYIYDDFVVPDDQVEILSQMSEREKAIEEWETAMEDQEHLGSSTDQDQGSDQEENGVDGMSQHDGSYTRMSSKLSGIFSR